jgi:hypothetical protein
MASIDYTPVILAQLTDLQMRVTKQDTLISALKAEVERLGGKPVNVVEPTSNSTMRTSVPLRPKPHGDDGRDTIQRQRYQRDTPQSATRERYERSEHNGGTRSRPKVASSGSSGVERPSMTLADVLQKDEDVTIQVGTGKDSEGNFTYTTAKGTFDGSDLVITECELATSLVGMKSSKPGEILYRFIDNLKETGHIKKTFTIAPWKLCFVERGGVRKSLEELRNVVG